MHSDELYQKVTSLFPNATLGEDNYGQIIIHTDLMFDPVSDDVVPFVDPTEEIGEV